MIFGQNMYKKTKHDFWSKYVKKTWFLVSWLPNIWYIWLQSQFYISASNSLLMKEMFQSKMTRTGSLAPSTRQQKSRKIKDPKAAFEFFQRKKSRKESKVKNNENNWIIRMDIMLIDEWMNELWVNDWVNELMNLWMSECFSSKVKYWLDYIHMHLYIKYAVLFLDWMEGVKEEFSSLASLWMSWSHHCQNA